LLTFYATEDVFTEASSIKHSKSRERIAKGAAPMIEFIRLIKGVKIKKQFE